MVKDLFDGLNPEEKQPRREPHVTTSVLEQLTRGFHVLANQRTVDESYDTLRENCKKIIPHQYTAKDVENLSQILNWPEELDDGDWIAGEYLSALISLAPARKFIIHTLDPPRDYANLGVDNTKILDIYGDAKGTLGNCMKSGRIRLFGNAEEVGTAMRLGKITIEGEATNAGMEMRGGTILVRKDCHEAGENMHGGKIIIKGNCKDVGEGMNGGEIYVHGFAVYVGLGMTSGNIYLCGTYKELHGFIGNIYHHGKLIFKDGKRL